MKHFRIIQFAMIVLAVAPLFVASSLSAYPREVPASQRNALLDPVLLNNSQNNVIEPVTNVIAPYDWYRYQGAKDDTNCPKRNSDCGPASVAMAIHFAKNQWVPISEVRQKMGGGCSDLTGIEQIEKALKHWKVQFKKITGMDAVREAVNVRGHIVIVLVNTEYISKGKDYDQPNSNPYQNEGRYSKGKPHILIVKGFSSDNKWVITYDPDVFERDVYWYSGRIPKGKDRRYEYGEFAEGFARLTNTAFEILELPEENITGVVRSSEGQPLPGVMVVFSNNLDKNIVTTTGSDGRYRMLGLQTNDSYVLAIKGNLLGAVPSQSKVDQEIIVRPSSVNRIVLPKNGSVRVNFVNTYQTACNGKFDLVSPSSTSIFADYLAYAGLGVDLGDYNAGTELVFSLTPQSFCSGSTYLSTDPSRAAIIQPEGGPWFITWEDYNDNDFNDLVVRLDYTPKVQRFLKSPVSSPNALNLDAGVHSEILPPVEAYMDHTVRIETDILSANVVTFQGYDSFETNPSTLSRSNYDGNIGTAFRLLLGTQVRPAASGTVIYAGQESPPCSQSSTPARLANVVKIRHDNGYTTEYWWLDTITPFVTVGAFVSGDTDILGTSGLNGCIGISGLHFVVRNPQGIPVDPFGWKPRPNTFWFALRDPWQQHYASYGIDATSYPLWTTPTTTQSLVATSGITIISSPSGQLTVAVPSGAISGPLRVEIEDAAEINVVTGQHMFRIFTVVGFTIGDRVVTTLTKPAIIDFSIQGMSITELNSSKVYIWDSVNAIWLPLSIKMNSRTNTLRVETYQLGTFAVVSDLVAPTFVALPLIGR